MDWDSKAKAIWSTLDEMAAKDPEAYKAFIQQQIAEMEGLAGAGEPVNFRHSLAGMKHSFSRATDAAFNINSTDRIPKKNKTGSAALLATELEKLEIQTPAQSSSETDTKNKLTDEIFTRKSSILSTIVKKLDGDLNEEEYSGVDIRLPSSSELCQKENDAEKNKSPQKSARLIEEL